MKNNIWFKKSLALALVITLGLCSYSFPLVVAANGDISPESFIEFSIENTEGTTFTLSDIGNGIETYAMLDDAEEFYTSAYNLPIETETVNSESSRAILPDQSYSLVSNVNTSPYSKTVLIYLKFQKDDGSFVYSVGTGFMVGNKVLLTAGHVIWHTTLQRNPYEIRVILKYSADHTYVTELSSVSTYYHPQSWVFSANFIDNDAGTVDYNYDWCYLTMFADIGKTYTGWYGIGTTTGSITDKEIYVTGYPNVSGKRFNQYESSGVLNSTSSYRVSHTCSTEGGHSGSPLFSENYVVWGIHTASGGSSYNTGVRITKSLYTLLVNKKAETD